MSAVYIVVRLDDDHVDTDVNYHRFNGVMDFYKINAEGWPKPIETDEYDTKDQPLINNGQIDIGFLEEMLDGHHVGFKVNDVETAELIDNAVRLRIQNPQAVVKYY